MKTNRKKLKITYILGIILFLLGSIAPLEGSILVLIGSILLVISSYKRKSRYWKRFFISSIITAIGISFLWFASFEENYDFKTDPSIWTLPILLYPVGWFVIIITLIQRQVKTNK